MKTIFQVGLLKIVGASLKVCLLAGDELVEPSFVNNRYHGCVVSLVVVLSILFALGGPDTRSAIAGAIETQLYISKAASKMIRLVFESRGHFWHKWLPNSWKTC